MMRYGLCQCGSAAAGVVLLRLECIARRICATANTHAGGMCINDVMSHVGIDDLPFGGVGASGMGKYHGHEGFLTMSNAKAVLEKSRIYSCSLHSAAVQQADAQAIIKKHLLK
jgi:coniferyl-aldehyde dehydrogenase